MGKRAISLLLSILMILSVTAVAAFAKAPGVTGKILSKNNTKVTVLTGKLSSWTGSQMMGGGAPGAPAQPGQGSGSGSSGSGSGQKPPEMPKETKKSNSAKAQKAETVFEAGTAVATYDLKGVTDVSKLNIGDVIEIHLNDQGKPTKVEPKTVTVSKCTANQGTAATTITENGTIYGKTYTSNKSDENALRVDGAIVWLNSPTIDKASGKTTDPGNGDFYGINAGFLATNGATVFIDNANIRTNAQGGNGSFSYGAGTTVNIRNSIINTYKDNSGGIQTTGGGTTNATNLKVTTRGNSAAAIRSDRGGGFVNVNGGRYESQGYNSPAIYSTAQIRAKNAVLRAENSEALVIEGKNSIALENTDVTGNMSRTKSSAKDINVHNVMIYQSMSGDAEVGTAKFSMKGGSLTGYSGDLFYITNTDANVVLDNVKLINHDKDGNLFTISGNNAQHGWGTAGKNGATANITCKNERMSGNIVVDDISTMTLKLTDGSNFTGTVNVVPNAAKGTKVANNAKVIVDEGSTWKLTGNCKISSLENHGKIDFNGYTITLADGTVLK